MWNCNIFLRGLCVLFAAASLAGCGGGGLAGGGELGGTRVSTFITDSMDGNDHVWVTIHRIELLGTGGPVTIFENGDGSSVDLKTLRDDLGNRFAFLGEDSVPSGAYSGVRVTMAKGLTVFPAGASAGIEKQFADSFDNGAGQTAVDLAFSGPKNLGGGEDDLVIDFDLANWQETGNIVTPVLAEGSEDGLNDDSRHEEGEYEGTITGLSGTAPNQSFTLADGDNTVKIVLSETTDLYCDDGSGSPTLANGQSVEVRGIFDPAMNNFTASALKIDNDGREDPHELEGRPSQGDEAAGTFMLTVHEADGFLPDATDVQVAVNGAEVEFFSDGGLSMTKAEFFNALTSAEEVEVEGVYDSASNTFTATKAKLDSNDESNEDQEFHGTVTASNAELHSLTLSVTSWEGSSWTSGNSLSVQASAEVRYKDAAGNEITAEQFFAAIASGGSIEAGGLLVGGVLHADKFQLHPSG